MDLPARCGRFFFVFASFFNRFLCRILSGRQTQTTVDAGTSGSGDYTGSKTEISHFSCNFCVGSCVITGPTCTSVYFERVGGYTGSDIEIPRTSHDFFVESCMAARPKSESTLVQVGLMITQDPTQKLYENHAVFVLYPV